MNIVFSLQELLIYALIIVVGLLIAEVIRLNSRIHHMFGTSKRINVEEAMISFIEEMRYLDKKSEQFEEKFRIVENKLRNSIQHINTVRFNPFSDQGSNQSFATAFIDEKGDGVVVSSLYARDRVAIYAKPVEKYSSTYELSAEEQEAIEQSKP